MVNGSNANITGMKVCSTFCDPTNPQNATGFQPCGSGANCFPDTDGYAFCFGPTVSSGTQGADCTSTTTFAPDPTLCAPAYSCVGSITGTCYKSCKVSGGSCPASTTCHSYSTKEYAGSAEIGYCK